MTDEARYEPASIEPKWQAFWEKNETFRAERRPGREKRYLLDMFPYPSGAGLHVGHPEGYTATDIIARFERMRGRDVMHPMGFDAFGLPAEQHAIATGTQPAATTKKNIDAFRRQLKSLGLAYDWSRELSTTDPAYVKWTQWIFLRLFERGLAFQSESPVNWCEQLGTVLANEEVIDGRSERGNFPVVRLPLRQWTLKITAYADRLLSGLEGIDWPDTKAKQIDWIGRSEGAEIVFPLDAGEGEVRVFTTRADTLFGATYVVLAPEHPLVDKITKPEQRDKVQAYVEVARRRSDRERQEAKEKTGVATGAFVRHPLSDERLPVWTADYVLGAYGTGAVMAVPAHDERDFAFAKVHALPIREVVTTKGACGGMGDVAFVDDGVLADDGDAADAHRAHGVAGLSSADAREKITSILETRNRGAKRVTYKLRDWVFSRQRYWGEPIPIYYPVETTGDPRRGAEYTIRYGEPIAVRDDELPVSLPELADFSPTGDPLGPLSRALEWRFFERDGKWFARETNTMPQWAGSCWYYLRYLDPSNERELVSKKAYDDWMPVDLYVGGNEHAVLHLLYARFWHQVLFDIGVVKHSEPFTKLVHQGTILGEDNQKMSKSRGNVVNPDDVIRDFGADALRLYEMFMGPLEVVKPWQTSGIQGVRRFLDRMWTACARPVRETTDASDAELLKVVHRAIKKVTQDIEQMKFNTAVSTLMMLARAVQEVAVPPRLAVEALVLLAAPFAPHIAEELWEKLGHEPSIANVTWPAWDEAFCVDDVVEIPVQVNGKVRGRITIAKDADSASVLAMAKSDDAVASHLAGKPIKKEIYVPGKIVTLVV